MMNNKGIALMWEKIIKWIIGLIILLIVISIIFALTGQGNAIFDMLDKVSLG